MPMESVRAMSSALIRRRAITTRSRAVRASRLWYELGQRDIRGNGVEDDRYLHADRDLVRRTPHQRADHLRTLAQLHNREQDRNLIRERRMIRAPHNRE